MKGKTLFLKASLTLHAFEKTIFKDAKDSEVILHILNLMNDGMQTNFLLNVLSLLDISVWKNRNIKWLIDIIA